MYIYIWDWGDHQLRLICAQVRHPSPAATFTRVPGRCLHWSPTPPGPRWPPALKYMYYKMMNGRSFLRLYRRCTHTHSAFGRVVFVQMRWRRRWRGNEGEMNMKMNERLLNQNAKRGTQKKREKTQGKRKAEGRRTRNKTSGGGEDGSAWTNLTQRKPTPTSARDGPDRPGEGRTHEIGDQWGTSWWTRETNNKIRGTQFHLQQRSCVTPLRDRSQVVPQWQKRLFKFHRIGCSGGCKIPLYTSIFGTLELEPHFVRKGCSGGCKIAIYTSIFDTWTRTSFRATRLQRRMCIKSQFNAIYTSIFDTRTSFRAKRLQRRM